MEEFNLKESVGDSKPTLKNNGSKKKIIIIILVVIGLIGCYLVGYIIGTNLGQEKKNDKKNNTDIKEETKLDEESVSKENSELLESKEAVQLAEDLYMKGISAHTCSGVELNYDNVKIIDDLEYYEVINWSELRSVFSKNAKVKGQLGQDNYYPIDEMVIEKSGKYYDMECGRGSHMGYRGTNFEIVSINSDIIIYDANSKYCTEDSDYEENCKNYIVSELFVIEKEDNDWKISRMVYPNN